MKAWTFQDPKQVKARGADNVSWYAGWIDPDGKRRCKSCGPGKRGKNAAEKLARKVEGAMLAGTYQTVRKQSWDDFRKRYDETVIGAMGAESADTARFSLDRFEVTMKPQRVSAINAETLDEFVARRVKDKVRGDKPVSKATVNRELRYVRAALRVAHDWGYIAKVPRFKFLKVAEKLPTFVPPEHFAKLYQACESARLPGDVANILPADWWRGLLMLAYLTGWRIGALLSLKWGDVNLDEGTALSQADDNKGKRDALVPLHGVAIEHLRKLSGSFDSHVFPWNHSRRRLYDEFYRLQSTAGVKPSGKDWYGWHDLRRAFATLNAQGLDLFTLQRLMQHKNLETTKLYVNMANRLKPAVAGLYIPDVAIEGNPREAGPAVLCG